MCDHRRYQRPGRRQPAHHQVRTALHTTATTSPPQPPLLLPPLLILLLSSVLTTVFKSALVPPRFPSSSCSCREHLKQVLFPPLNQQRLSAEGTQCTDHNQKKSHPLVSSFLDPLSNSPGKERCPFTRAVGYPETYASRTSHSFVCFFIMFKCV